MSTQINTQQAVEQGYIDGNTVTNVADPWVPPPADGVAWVPYASEISPPEPSPNVDTIYNVGRLTGDVMVNAPAGTPRVGQRIRFRFQQDEAGQHTVSWQTGPGGYMVTVAFLGSLSGPDSTIVCANESTSMSPGPDPSLTASPLARFSIEFIYNVDVFDPGIPCGYWISTDAADE